jgi:hypothetical protein
MLKQVQLNETHHEINPFDFSHYGTLYNFLNSNQHINLKISITVLFVKYIFLYCNYVMHFGAKIMVLF